MLDAQLDQLARALAAGTSRRQVVKALGGLALGALLAPCRGAVLADPKKPPKHCKSDADCGPCSSCIPSLDHPSQGVCSSDCRSCETCNGSACVRISGLCCSNADCPSFSPICDTSFSMCVECVSNADCLRGTCCQGLCTDAALPYCCSSGTLCNQLCCGSTCCLGNETCSNGQCIQSCSSGLLACASSGNSVVTCCPSDTHCCGAGCCLSGWECCDSVRGLCCPTGKCPTDVTSLCLGG
jgi:hypothetical protein